MGERAIISLSLIFHDFHQKPNHVMGEIHTYYLKIQISIISKRLQTSHTVSTNFCHKSQYLIIIPKNRKVTYILEGPWVDSTRITNTAASGSWLRSSSLSNNGLMLDCTRTHNSIHCPVCNSTSSSKSHTYRNNYKNNVSNTISIWKFSFDIMKPYIPWAIVEPIPPRTDPPLEAWTGAGGG